MAKKRVVYEMEETYLDRVIAAVCWRHPKRTESELTDSEHARAKVADYLHRLVNKHDEYVAKQALPMNDNAINITVEDVI